MSRARRRRTAGSTRDSEGGRRAGARWGRAAMMVARVTVNGQARVGRPTLAWSGRKESRGPVIGGATRQPARRLRRAVCRPDPRDDSLGDPGAVRRRQPSGGGLARRRHAVPVGAAAGRRRRRWSAGCTSARGASALQYGSGQGDPGAARADLRGHGARGHRRAHPDDVVVTVGSPAGARPGHPDLLRPRRRGARRGAQLRRCARARSRPTRSRSCTSRWTTTGWSRRRCTEALAALARAGKRVKFLYTIPNFHNPAGVSLSVERRERVLDLCHEAGLLVLEDNPYGLLGFDGDPFPALRAYTDEGVIYLGSFSKTFAPGLRVGWALAPHARAREARARLGGARCSARPRSTRRSSPSTSRRCPGSSRSKNFRELYRERRDAMLARAGVAAAGRLHVDPSGRRLLRLGHPAGGSGRQGHAAPGGPARVAYVPGVGVLRRRLGRTATCGCRTATRRPSGSREGVRRLAGVVEEELELLETFGPAARAQRSGRRAGQRPPARRLLTEHTMSDLGRVAGPRRWAVLRAGRLAALRPPGGRRAAGGGHRGRPARRRRRPAARARRRPAGGGVRRPARRHRRGRRDPRRARPAARAVRRRGRRAPAGSPGTSRPRRRR